MGLYYYARNPTTKAAYELGKGQWYHLRKAIDVNPLVTVPFEQILKIIREDIIVPFWVEDKTVQDLMYHEFIATEIFNLGVPLEIVSDGSVDNPLDGYTLVGSRYKEAE